MAVFLQGSKDSFKIRRITAVFKGKGICPAERRGEQCGPERRFGDRRLIRAVRLIAEKDIMTGNWRKQAAEFPELQNHFQSTKQSACLEADLAVPAFRTG